MSGKDGRIDLTRSGGFGGITMRASVDTAELAPADAALIEQAVKGASLSRPKETSGSASNVDRFQYDLTVTAGDERHQLSAGEKELPADLRHLLDDLLRRR